MTINRPFLTAHWRHLLMLNYVVEPDVLEPLVPRGTVLDLWRGRALVSLVGFQFLHTRLKGWPIPGHQNFPEVNLRFYVRREAADGWRRGVVFVRELVPRRAVTWVANTIYDEKYVTVPMTHRVQLPGSPTDRTGRVEFGWRYRGCPFQLVGEFSGLPAPLRPDSEEEFITEHYWGYTRHSCGATSEYPVEHPRWRVWRPDCVEFTGDATDLYGSDFAAVLREPPCSSLIADGSSVTVYTGRKIEDTLKENSLSPQSVTGGARRVKSSA